MLSYYIYFSLLPFFKIDSRKEQLDLAKKIAKAGQERSPRELRQQAAHVSISFQASE